MDRESIIRASDKITPFSTALFAGLLAVITKAYIDDVTIMPLKVGIPEMTDVFGMIDIRETTFFTVPSSYYANPTVLGTLLTVLAAPLLFSGLVARRDHAEQR